MAKSPLSAEAEWPTRSVAVMRTRTVVVSTAGTDQANWPVLAVAVTMSV
jgi:hypothetical protein